MKKLHAISGNTQWLDGGSMFGNAPKALWEKWIPADERNRIHLATRALLFQTGSKNILFEAGIGAFFEPKLKERYGVAENEHMLLQNLGNFGLQEKDINAVVLSHLHFDHAGGLLSAYTSERAPHLLFPNARYYVGKRHWERALNPHLRERASFIPLLHKLLGESDRLMLIEDSFHEDLEDIRFHFSDGHTVGLMLSEIADENGDLVVFASDLVPGVPWIHLPITMGYDRYPELLVDEKRKLLEYVSEKGGSLFFTHDLETVKVQVAYDKASDRYSNK
ncbi:MAG: MBL fold metallo-hydrolase [Parachlamydiaceae bacterium]|nr:MBL fold metallo-hydrolase [Parachlamydiaceae bacterium]